MHSFAELVVRSTSFTLSALQSAADRTAKALQSSAATPLVKTLQMIQLQKAILAVGMFSMFEAMLQDRLICDDGFREAGAILRGSGQDDLAGQCDDFQLAINVLKHGRGRSYDALVAKAGDLSFRIKLPGEAFFFEGDVSEISTLVEVDDRFVTSCAELIWKVSGAIRTARPESFL